jgi:hypothetical protein
MGTWVVPCLTGPFRASCRTVLVLLGTLGTLCCADMLGTMSFFTRLMHDPWHTNMNLCRASLSTTLTINVLVFIGAHFDCTTLMRKKNLND